MKYTHTQRLFLSIIASIVMLPVSTNALAEDASMCAQVIQPAVNANGECKEFPTPCDVPENWKTIQSCTLVQPVDFGSRLEEVNKRRDASRWDVLRKKLEEKRRQSSTNEASSQASFGTSALIKNDQEYKSRQQRLLQSMSNRRRRTFTQPKIQSAETREQVKVIQNKTQKKSDTETNENRRTNKALRMKPSIGSITNMKRTGYMTDTQSRVGVQTMTTTNWDARKNVLQFWERPKPDPKPSKLKNNSDLESRLDNKRFRRGRLERDFGLENR